MQETIFCINFHRAKNIFNNIKDIFGKSCVESREQSPFSGIADHVLNVPDYLFGLVISFPFSFGEEDEENDLIFLGFAHTQIMKNKT